MVIAAAARKRRRRTITPRLTVIAAATRKRRSFPFGGQWCPPPRLSLLTPLCCRCRVAVIVSLLFFLLLPFLLSSLPLGVIVATVVPVATVVTVATVLAVATIVVVAPDPIALTAFVVALAVVATTAFAVAVTLVVDCCVPSPPEEDHHLPPLLGKVPSWPSSICPLCPSSLCCPSCRRRHCPHHWRCLCWLLWTLCCVPSPVVAGGLNHQKPKISYS